jgi:hypothetical protein
MVRAKCVSRGRFRSSACLVPALLVAGCLDAGPAPLGRHLARTRDPEQVHFAAGAVGAPNRIIFMRSEATPISGGYVTQELSTVDDPGPGGATPVEPRVVGDRVTGAFGQCGTPTCDAPIDSLGRFYVLQATFMPFPGGGTQEIDDLVRVDPATGEQRDFGPNQEIDVSADRTRVVVTPQPPVADAMGNFVLPPDLIVDLDDRTTTFDLFGPRFAGDDLYYLSTADSKLMRLPKGSLVPEAAADGVGTFQVFQTQRGPLLVLTRFGSLAMGHGEASTLYDATTRTEETLPDTTALASSFVFSPSGRTIATQRVPFTSVNGGIGPPGDSVILTLADRQTGQEVPATAAGSLLSMPVFRPRHEDEAWFGVVGDELFRWRVGAQPEMIAHEDSPFGNPSYAWNPQQLIFAGQPVFTPDGEFRLVARDTPSVRVPVDLKSANDAAAAPFQLNQPDMGVADIWPLADGRLLVENWLTDALKSDIYLADPVARTQRQVVNSGTIIATGRDRCLALLHWIRSGGTGDLTIVDYATGAETLIAQNVHGAVIDASADPDDALAPGTRVAFLVRNRIASPYDGVWAFELP